MRRSVHVVVHVVHFHCRPGSCHLLFGFDFGVPDLDRLGLLLRRHTEHIVNGLEPLLGRALPLYKAHERTFTGLGHVKMLSAGLDIATDAVDTGAPAIGRLELAYGLIQSCLRMDPTGQNGRLGVNRQPSLGAVLCR